MGDKVDLSPENRTTLHVLAFLYFRMGRLESAARIYAALAAMPPLPDASQPDWRTLAGQAAVALEQEDGAAALTHARAAMAAGGFPPDTPEAEVLKRMYAKALWLCGNKDEARALISLLPHPDQNKAAS